ncbi:Holliday junction DNA helicase subunit RuvA [Microbacteriaceae bacterium MWH-Ta3]|nr:Holliday junction DNA helicase subunit RuvA [Microbacteriaceae bacterium MWH-Ta3]
MIASLRGTVSTVSSGDAVIDVGGVGYQVLVTPAHAQSLRVGQEVDLVTVLIPREDEWTLFGFMSAHEKALFGVLRSVTGVGPKTALGILGQLTADEIADAVATGDDSVFRRVSGIGQKTASLIIVSLTGKMPQAGSSSTSSDLVAALTGLGWSDKAARDVARDVTTAHPNASVAELLRHALATMKGAAS